MTYRKAIAVLTAGTAMIVISSAPAAAQTGPSQVSSSPPQDAQVDDSRVAEIVVTAQRRSENLQNVPISIQSLSATQLANRGNISASDLTALVPGLIFPEGIGAGTPFLRGNGNVTIVGGENAVAFYIDGIFLQSPNNNLMSFNNIERVEVLKGPQGTLYGRNATGGLIHIITKDPTQATHVDTSIGYGSYNDLTGNLFATGGLTPNVAASIAVTAENRFNGWGRNIGTGNELFKANSLGIQNKFLFTDDSHRFSVLTNVIYSQRTTNEGAVIGIVPGTTSPGGLLQNIGQYTINNPAFDPYTDSDQFIGSVKVKYEFDWGQVSNLLAYGKSNSYTQMNLTAAPVNLSPAVTPILYYLRSKDETWTNELQLQSLSNSKLQWVLGGFYMSNRSDSDNSVYATFTTVGALPALTYTVNDGGNQIRSYATYAQATYPILPSTRLTLGLRYTVDEKDFFILKTFYNAAGAATRTQNQFTFATAVPPVVPSKTWSRLTWRASLDHKVTDDVMAYVAYNTGFKGGQYSTLSPNNPAAEPEKNTAYTAGLKAEFFDHRVRFNIEAFYNEYRDIQLKTIVNSSAPFVFNAASGISKGVDVDFQAILTRGLTLSGSFEVLDAHYSSFANAPCYQRLATGGIGPIGTGVCDLSGAPMIRSPKFTGNLAMQYQFSLNSGGKIALQVADNYNSGFNWDPDQLVKQEAYHNLSASASWTSPDRSYQFSVWGKNMTNSHIWSSAQEAAPYESYYPGKPATYGATFSFHY